MTDLFTGTRGRRDAPIAIIGEAWGAEEKRKGMPFVGGSGQEQSRILQECAINEDDCFFSNVVNEQPHSNKFYNFLHKTKEARAAGMEPIRGLYPKDNVIEGLRRLEEQLRTVNPKLVIGYGNYTLWGLTESNFRVRDSKRPEMPYGYKVPRGVGNFRGSHLHTREGFKFLPTYHPAAALRNWPWRYQIKHDLAARVKKALNGEWDPPKYNFQIKPEFDQVITVLENLLARANLENELWISEDIETLAGHISCLGIAWSHLDAICIPFIKGFGGQSYWNPAEEFEIVRRIRLLNTHPKVRLIGQNFFYDAQYMALYWQHIPRIAFDTRVMHHLCYPGTEQNLNYLSSMYCNYHKYWKDEGKEWHSTFTPEQHWVYNCKDCVSAYEVAFELMQVIQHYGLEKQADIQVRQTNMIVRMMVRGVRVDKTRRAELVGQLAEMADERGHTLERLLPEDVYPRKPKLVDWYRSPPQQMEIFYDILGLKKVIDRKSLSPTVGDEAMEKFKLEEPVLEPICTRLQEYRSLEAFSKFVKSKTDEDGRMRCQFTPTAETFRWTSSKSAFNTGGNLQNLPKGSEE